jgi:hypothetical protein
VKIGIDGKPKGMSEEQRIKYQCMRIETYWHSKGELDVFAEPYKTPKGEWKINSNVNNKITK